MVSDRLITAKAVQMPYSSNGSVRIKGEKLIGKFVIIRYERELFFVFGEVAIYPYHANLVVSFCDQYEIASGWEHQPDLVEVYDPGWKVLGGGWLDLDQKAQTARVYGASSAYGPYDRPSLATVVEDTDLFRQYPLKIG